MRGSPRSARGRPVTASSEAIEHARLLQTNGDSLPVIAAKTGIAKTSLHRYLTDAWVHAPAQRAHA
ncbi:MAG: recombinase family protein [Actinomycetia bacterium]|nr:recombinase family protein [Actinomycetes bacterium]